MSYVIGIPTIVILLSVLTLIALALWGALRRWKHGRPEPHPSELPRWTGPLQVVLLVVLLVTGSMLSLFWISLSMW